MTAPWFARFLPQREAAFHVMRQFARDEGFPESSVDEVRAGPRVVHLLGEAPDGRQYGVGYEWTDEQLTRYLPPRPPQPRFEGGGAWPVDVLVPRRKVPSR